MHQHGLLTDFEDHAGGGNTASDYVDEPPLYSIRWSKK
jgi:hypothetical protein